MLIFLELDGLCEKEFALILSVSCRPFGLFSSCLRLRSVTSFTVQVFMSCLIVLHAYAIDTTVFLIYFLVNMFDRLERSSGIGRAFCSSSFSNYALL